MLDPSLLRIFGQHFGLLDRDRPDEHRLAELLLRLRSPRRSRANFSVHRLVEVVVLVDAQHLDVGRDRDHVHLVDVEEFRRLGHRRAGHARQLRIHAEIILEGDRGERLVLRLDVDAFLGLDRLVEPVRPAPPVHHAAGEFVDDDDLPVLHDVVDVLLEHHVGLEGLVQVVDDLRVGDVVEVAALDQPCFLEHPLGLFGAVLGEDDALLLLVLVIVGRLRASSPARRPRCTGRTCRRSGPR